MQEQDVLVYERSPADVPGSKARSQSPGSLKVASPVGRRVAECNFRTTLPCEISTCITDRLAATLLKRRCQLVGFIFVIKYSGLMHVGRLLFVFSYFIKFGAMFAI